MIRTSRAPLGASILAAASATLLASSALAADLGGPRRGPRFEPPPPPLERPRLDIERWTGFYIGGTLGYGFGTTTVDDPLFGFGYDKDGGVGTVFAGFNKQFGMGVIGLEADIGTGYLSGSGGPLGNQVTSELNAIGSLRGRIGFLTGPSLLLYATAGVAWADFDVQLNGGAQRSETYFGYQVGAGAELMFTPQWTLRLEYIYTDLGNERTDFPLAAQTIDHEFHTLRAGLSLKF